MNIKEDLRVKKTKAALDAAFSEMISKVPFEDISVNELCSAAGIRRATFYKHYNDKYDFLREYVGHLRITYESNISIKSNLEQTVDYYINYAKKVVEYLNDNENIVNNLLKSNLLHTIIGIIAEKNYQDTCEKLVQSEKHGLKLPASVETVSAMLIGGIENIIFQWLTSGKNVNIDVLSEEIAVLVKKIFQNEGCFAKCNSICNRMVI